MIFVGLTTQAQINTQNVIYTGRSQLYFGNYLNAIEQFNIVIKIQPHLPEPYYYRGISKMYLEDYRGALADLSKAIEIKPFYPDAYINRGLVNFYLRNFEASLEDYSRALELDNENPDLYNNRGLCKAEMGDFQGAVDDYTKSIELKPKNFRAYYNRSFAHNRLEDWSAAIEDCNNMIRIKPNSPTGYMSRGILKIGIDEYAGALRDFDMAIYVDPSNSYAYLYRGLVKYRLESYEAAIDDYNVALSYDRTLAAAYFNRAIAKEVLGREDYMTDYNNASALESRYAKRPWKTKEEREEAQKQQMLAWQQQTQNQVQRTGTSNVGNITSADQEKAKESENSSKGEIDYEELRKRKMKADLIVAETNSNDAETNARLQNQYVEIELLPDFTIYNLNNPSKIGSEAGYFSLVLDNLNASNNYDPYLIISSREPVGNYNESYFRNQILKFEARIRQNPGISENYLYLGIFKLLLEDFNGAIADFNHSIELDDRNMLSYFLRANTRLKIIEKIEAIRNNSTGSLVKNNESMLLDPNRITTTTFDGYDDILTDLQLVLYMNPNFYFGYFNRGNLYCKADKFRLAIDEYSQAIQIYPEFAEAYYNRGLVKVLLNDIEGGAKDLSRAGELGISEAYNVIKRYCN